MRILILVSAALIIGCRGEAQSMPDPNTESLATRSSPKGEPPSSPREAVSKQSTAPFEPVTLNVKQRTTIELPVPDGRFRLTIDDITRGQVMASLSLSDGDVVHAPVSMRVGESLSFDVDGQVFQLELTKLDNELIGEDFAEFRLSRREEEQGDGDPPAERKQLSEHEKIERLIAAVARQPDAVFIRNGQEHSSSEAADHLRHKWEAAGDRVETAELFIEQVASRSSLTGREYMIRFPDGSEQSAAEFLREELRKVESSPSE